MQETQVLSQDQEEALEKEMTNCSSILAWEIPWTEEPGGLPSTGSQRVRHNLVTKQQQQQPGGVGSQSHLLPRSNKGEAPGAPTAGAGVPVAFARLPGGTVVLGSPDPFSVSRPRLQAWVFPGTCYP